MAKRRLLLLGVGLALAGSAPAQGQKTLGVLFSGDASVRGAVLLRAQATEVLSGSQITAGDGSALLKLERGGQLRICPKTNLSLNAGASGQALSLGLNAGAMELDYALDSGADSLITPDFRLLMISPGNFHLAISVASSGDTCMRSLPGNSASVFITEMMGNDSYQLAPGKNVLFMKGKVALATQAPAVCGCPETAPPPKIEVAQAPPAQPAAAETPAAPADRSAETHASETQASAALPPTGASTPAAPPLSEAAPAEQPEVAHLEVDSRFSYRGDAETQDFYGTAARLSVSTDNSKLALALLPQITRPGEANAGTQPAAPAPAAPPTTPSASAAPSAPAATPNSKVTVAERKKHGGLGGFFRRFFGSDN